MCHSHCKCRGEFPPQFVCVHGIHGKHRLAELLALPALSSASQFCNVTKLPKFCYGTKHTRINFCLYKLLSLIRQARFQILPVWKLAAHSAGQSTTPEGKKPGNRTHRSGAPAGTSQHGSQQRPALSPSKADAVQARQDHKTPALLILRSLPKLTFNLFPERSLFIFFFEDISLFSTRC